MEGSEGISFLKWGGKRIKPLLIVQIIAFTLACIFSSQYFMPKEYKSYAVVYPYNISEYSKEVPSEQMLEFLSSVDIKNEVIQRFNLVQHYNLSNKNEGYDKLIAVYDKNVVINPTEYGAVEITVYDINADTAYKMVTGILNALNTAILKVQRDKSVEVVNMLKMQMNNEQKHIDSLTALSKSISTQYGMLEYVSQSKELSKAYYQALLTNKGSKQFDDIQLQMKNLEEKGIEFRSVNQRLEEAITANNLVEVKYEDALKDANKQITYWNMVSAPFKPDTYCYPLRTLIVLGTCFAAFVFSILFLRFSERTKS